VEYFYWPFARLKFLNICEVKESVANRSNALILIRNVLRCVFPLTHKRVIIIHTSMLHRIRCNICIIFSL